MYMLGSTQVSGEEVLWRTGHGFVEWSDYLRVSVFHLSNSISIYKVSGS